MGCGLPERDKRGLRDEFPICNNDASNLPPGGKTNLRASITIRKRERATGRLELESQREPNESSIASVDDEVTWLQGKP